MTYHAEYHLNVLDEEGRKTDLIHPGEEVEIHLKDGFKKRGIIAGMGPKGLSLTLPRSKGSTFYNFGNIKHIDRIYPGREMTK